LGLLTVVIDFFPRADRLLALASQAAWVWWDEEAMAALDQNHARPRGDIAKGAGSKAAFPDRTRVGLLRR
jgi:hypothetical protein